VSPSPRPDEGKAPVRHPRYTIPDVVEKGEEQPLLLVAVAVDLDLNVPARIGGAGIPSASKDFPAAPTRPSGCNDRIFK